MGSPNTAINTIYNERDAFVVIGLTGRTGSGCTTVAQILSTSKLNLHEPKEFDFQNNDERKYRVVYNYAKSNWSQFIIIEMTIVLASFVFQRGYEDLYKFISNKDEIKIHQRDELLVKLKDFEQDINNISLELLSYIKEDGHLDRDSKIQRKELKLLVKLRKLTNKFKVTLKTYTLTHETENDGVKKEFLAEAYTYFFQCFGNNVRASGNPFDPECTGEHMFDIARRANDFIKAIRSHQLEERKGTLICIDAIRNPYEAIYFQDRYSAFYLMSVNTEDTERLRRLSTAMNKSQIESLDTIEYPKDPTFEQQIAGQGIAACLQISDIHVYNPYCPTNYRGELIEQVVKFVMLMKHPGLITPSHIERCMQMAFNAKLNSGCLSRQVGAVITDRNYSIKAIGWNDVPSGQVPCNLRDIQSYCKNMDCNSHSNFEIENEKFSATLRDINEKADYSKLNGRLLPYCFKSVYNKMTGKENQVHTRALHAEENAFLQIVKTGGVGIEGGYLFTTASPCELCSKKAYQLGINTIYYIDPYPGISTDHILSFGQKNPSVKLFYGAIGSAYTKFYSQRLSIKDELKMLET